MCTFSLKPTFMYNMHNINTFMYNISCYMLIWVYNKIEQTERKQQFKNHGRFMIIRLCRRRYIGLYTSCIISCNCFHYNTNFERKRIYVCFCVFWIPKTISQSFKLIYHIHSFMINTNTCEFSFLEYEAIIILKFHRTCCLP